MSIGGDSISNNLRLQLDNNPRIQGLAKFITDIERDYFSQVIVRNIKPDMNHNNLVVELNCPLRLVELVYQIKAGCCTYDTSDEKQGQCSSPLEKAYFELSLKNETEIEIEEFALFLSDCSIIIKKIYPRSITEQLVNIFEAFSNHLEFLTNNLSEVPFEIYVPVFEEDLVENDTKIANVEQNNNERNDYYSYWGLYFEGDEDAAIYELPKKRIINGDLYMLNH